MPQLQNMVVNDRKTTPVAHTFVPRDIVDGKGTVIESTGVPIGNNRYTISLNRTKLGNYKAVVKAAFPVVQNQVINGVSTPMVVRTAYADLTFTFHETSSEAERNDVVGMIASSLSSTTILTNDTLVKLQGLY